MFKKILVPLDGSDVARRAMPIALALAKQSQGKIVLVRVPELVKMPMPEGIGGLHIFDELMTHRHDQSESYLGYIRQLYVEEDVPMTVHVQEGDAAGVVVDTAVTEGVDLIVMSTSGRTGLSRWMLGSVTEKVMRYATCPVLAVREGGLPEKMLITLDGSRLAEQSLAPGLAVAAALNLQVTLLRVQEPAEELDEDAKAKLRSEEKAWLYTLPEVLHQNALAYLEQVEQVVVANHKSLSHVQIAVTTGHAADSIVDFAERHDFDLIVMTTHGDTGMGRWAYGSVTERVVKSVHCAIMVARST